MGVSLADQGYSDPPARLLDWLLGIEGIYQEVESEAARSAVDGR